MAKKKIIPIFVPQGGCHQQCIFCNQRGITGVDKIPDVASLKAEMPQGGIDYEMAFYGGTFTALPKPILLSYLEFAKEMYDAGRIGSLRISTHPGALDDEIMVLLKSYGVTTIELGIQSMDDDVLKAAGRGHTKRDNQYAMFLVKNNGFSLGVQLMTGLPQDSPLKIFKGISEILPYSPSMVRIYPLLVLEDTPLAAKYRGGAYQPMSLHDAVALVTDMYAFFRYYEIPVIRMGLQPTDDLNCESDLLLDGPFHPAFGHLVRSLLMRHRLDAMLEKVKGDVTILCPKDEVALVYGEHGEHMKELQMLRRIRVRGILQEKNMLALAPYEKTQSDEVFLIQREQEFLSQYLSERIECI